LEAKVVPDPAPVTVAPEMRERQVVTALAKLMIEIEQRQIQIVQDPFQPVSLSGLTLALARLKVSLYLAMASPGPPAVP
jgi:hypothetical protein